MPGQTLESLSSRRSASAWSSHRADRDRLALAITRAISGIMLRLPEAGRLVARELLGDVELLCHVVESKGLPTRDALRSVSLVVRRGLLETAIKRAVQTIVRRQSSSWARQFAGDLVDSVDTIADRLEWKYGRLSRRLASVRVSVGRELLDARRTRKRRRETSLDAPRKGTDQEACLADDVSGPCTALSAVEVAEDAAWQSTVLRGRLAEADRARASRLTLARSTRKRSLRRRLLREVRAIRRDRLILRALLGLRPFVAPRSTSVGDLAASVAT